MFVINVENGNNMQYIYVNALEYEAEIQQGRAKRVVQNSIQQNSFR